MVVKLTYKNYEYILDTERNMMMKTSSDVVVRTKDFILTADKGEKIIDVAWQSPEKIVEYFGRNTFISFATYGARRELYWGKIPYTIEPPIINWRGITLFNPFPEHHLHWGIYVHPRKNYTIKLSGREAHVTNGKTFINVGKAGKETLLNENYIQKILEGVEKLASKNSWRLVKKHSTLMAETTDFYVYFVPEGKTCPIAPLTVENGTARIRVADSTGIIDLEAPATRIEDITENRKHAVKYPLEIPGVIKTKCNGRWITYTLKNSAEISYSTTKNYFRVKTLGGTRYYPLDKMENALKKLGVIG